MEKLRRKRSAPVLLFATMWLLSLPEQFHILVSIQYLQVCVAEHDINLFSETNLYIHIHIRICTYMCYLLTIFKVL